MAGRKRESNRKKKAEQARLDAKRRGALAGKPVEDEEALDVEVADGGNGESGETSTRKRNKDSKGKKIPTESERRNKGRIIDFKDAKRANSEGGTRAGRMDEYGHAKAKKKRKTKYVLDESAKKWLRNVIIAAVIVIAAIVIGIVALNSAEATRKGNSAPVKPEELTQSLVGMPPAGKNLVSETGKFDGFATIDGHDIAELFDLDVTSDEQVILKNRGQIIHDGIVSYNEEMSTTARLAAEEEARAASADGDGGASSNKSKAEEFADALNGNSQGE